MVISYVQTTHMHLSTYLQVTKHITYLTYHTYQRFFSVDLVPDFALHFWHVITNKVECVGYLPSNDGNDDVCCHITFCSFIIFAISAFHDATITMFLLPGNAFNPKPCCMFHFQIRV
jgi:hypothetical protein